MKRELEIVYEQKGSTSPIVIYNVSEVAADYAAGSRAFVQHRGHTEKELDAYEEGVRQGYLKAIADLEAKRVIRCGYRPKTK